MGKWKRGIALILTVCVLLSLLPPMQFVGAAEVIRRYELDTDGIDPGATYLIVNAGTAGSGNALRFYYSSSWNTDLRNQTLTIEKEDGVTFIDAGFANEDDCQFQFTATGSGHITHGNYKLDLSNEGFTSGTPSRTLTFTNVGSGQYRIYYTYWSRNYYLRCRNSEWSNTTSTSSVYLYKLVEHTVGYNVTFDGNGYTSGTMPENRTEIAAGDQITLPAPTNLRKDIGEDTWLFAGWNTAPDGSGTEYAPGETITVTEDITLYVEWYQQTKHTMSMITYLDGVATDVNKFAGYDRHFYAKLEGGDGTLIPMTRREEGTYSAKVADNGTYIIYAQTADGDYEPVHGHKIMVYNQAGITECLHYSVTYDIGDGVWAEGEDPGIDRCHNGETVYASVNVPTREGYRFVGWKYQDKDIHPGHPITESADQKIVVTAVWEKLITVTFNLVIDHNSASEGGGFDTEPTMHDVQIMLLREDNGVNTLVEEKTLTNGNYDPVKKITTYTLVYENIPQGTYHLRANKEDYVQSSVHGDDHRIDVTLKYTPAASNLHFAVHVNAENDAEKALMPKAVNVKVSYWGYNDEDELGWHIITGQEGNKIPSTIQIDENGYGTGSYTIWTKRSGVDISYDYRVEVTSFVLPDDSVVPASGNLVTYTPDGSGLYTATVSVEGEGRVPAYPAGNTTLPGAYFEGEQQMGIPTVTVEINPMTVTFQAGEGTVNGQQTISLENQYRYPALHDYVAVPGAGDKKFVFWVDENGKQAENLEDRLLPGNVTYTACYAENLTISGTVAADAVYEQDEEIVQINDIDRVKAVWVVLQKKVGDVYNDVDSVAVELKYQMVDGYSWLVGLGDYEFTDVPNDGTEYRVYILVLNYDAKFDNDKNGIYTEPERAVLVDPTNSKAQVNIHLGFAPSTYQQLFRVDASQIQKDLRPTGVLTQILYRDLGNVHNYQIISRHTVPPYGVKLELDPSTATAFGLCDVWDWHTNGTPYEYQLQVYKVFGNDVEGAYSKDGTEYTQECPYTIVYGKPNNYLQQVGQNDSALVATLVPNKYLIHLDLNLGDDTKTPVVGLEKYAVDNDHGYEQYGYIHTWSFAEEFAAYPYREGYVFKGWKGIDPNGTYNDGIYTEDGIHAQGGEIRVGNTLAKEVTLVAQWEKLQGTDCTVRYLELNTDKVLKGATMVTDVALGSTVPAVKMVAPIEGYVYAGALVNGTYVDKTDNPAMTVTNDPVQNLMIIYYLPDGSDGYTEQVESNLEINKTAVLEDNGTYTITMETWTKDNPITTKIWQDTPMDVVLVLDQSGSMYTSNSLNDLKDSVNNFVTLLADHGREYKVDHRIAIVGYASNLDSGYTNPNYPTAGKDGYSGWVNTGVFDSNGDFHVYPVTGFNYTPYTGQITADGTYYTYANGNYLLMTHHDIYRHLITEDEARQAILGGTQIFGYVEGRFVELTRNSSGLWLYGDRQLYSKTEFFTFHYNVWTHRDGLAPRQIHAYGVGADYTPTDGHQGVYIRSESREANPQKSIYQDALVPVSLGANGAGMATPGLLNAAENIGANGRTYVSYGLEMANSVFAANPLDPKEGRIRIVVVFTDGKPGDGSNFDEIEANNALEQSYIAAHTHGADVYTIGLYGDDVVAAGSDQDFFMTGLSSNYPDAKCMDDVWLGVNYRPATYGYRLDNGGPYFVEINGEYRALFTKSVYENRQYYTSWGYTNDSGQYVAVYKGPVADGHPVITDSGVGGYTIYRRYGNGYKETANSGYYTLAENAHELKNYFASVVEEITTNITTKIELESDTILRDIMNQGLVLTNGTEITVYTQAGKFDLVTGKVNWAVDAQGNPILDEKVSLTIGPNSTRAKGESGVEIITYNLNAANATDPTGDGYAPHTVDVTGYDFHNWYISENHDGYKMIVTITRVEATDDVQWGCSTDTNNEKSGLWLPADDEGNRQLLLPFDQPTTIFVERAYVLDYGKEFTLSNWYFDDEDGKEATPIHIDCDITNGMNWFDPENPNTANAVNGEYGNTQYGNVQVKNGTVTYSPTTMNWGGYDQFYVFGDTWRKTVLAQDANENGNLWNKVTVIPANNIYYEDSFITTEDTTQNGIEGFTFTFAGAWTVVGQDSGNTEIPEHLESAPYGDVHGWTDSLGDDVTFTDGSAHFTNTPGASAQFTFTGTGVEVYTRTNATSGMVVAVLNSKTVGEDGKEVITLYKSLAMDNLAVSGDYYHIPTVTFKDLPYGTYTLQLIATAATMAVEGTRSEYYIDGVRIHNPLGNTTNYKSDIVKDAYGLETNAVFTEVRDILLDYGDFNADMPDSTDGKLGAVFIDWVQPGQEGETDRPGEEFPDVEGQPTYELGTFEKYGPKNEVYLSAGQAIVLKVAEGNHYYVGLKSLTGAEVTANVSGIDQDDPTAIKLSHTTDLYYQITPVNGYIVIQNGNTDGDALLSITNLRTTNLTAVAKDGGILPVTKQEAVQTVAAFTEHLMNKPAEEILPPQPEEQLPSAEEQAQANQQRATALFTAVRRWLENS